MADLSQFAEATAAVKHSPHAVSAWEEAEGLAADLNKPDDIVALYNETLAGTLEPEVAEMIGERAGGFCDEWFGDDPKVLEKILARVIEIAPASESALQRLSVLLPGAEPWDDVPAPHHPRPAYSGVTSSPSGKPASTSSALAFAGSGCTSGSAASEPGMIGGTMPRGREARPSNTAVLMPS